MECEFCRHGNEQGGSFCARCGAALNQQPQQHYQPQQQYHSPEYQPQESPSQEYQPQQTPPQDFIPHSQSQEYLHIPSPAKTGTDARKSAMKLPSKKLLMFAAPVIVIIIAAIIIIPMLTGSGSTMVKDYLLFIDDGSQVVVSGNNNAKLTLDGKMRSSDTSMDGSKAVVLTDFNYISGGTLWFVTTSGSTKIADNVYTYLLSDSGNGVAYFTDYDSRNETAVLYLYDASGRKSTKISEGAHYDGSDKMSRVSISPDGKSITYIADYNVDYGEYTGYIKVDGKAPDKLGDDIYAVAISDGGRHLYYVKIDRDGNESLHARSGRTENRLTSEVRDMQIMFNKDYSEIIFTVHDGGLRSFYSANGSDRTRISGGALLHMVLPRGSQSRSVNSSFASIIVYGKRTLSDFVAMTSDGLAYYDNRLEPNKISGTSPGNAPAEITTDGKTLYYINDTGRLSSIDPTQIDAVRLEIDRNVASFTVSSDGKSVYYVNYEHELFFVSGSGSSKRISDDVAADSLAMSHRGNRVFFLVDYGQNRGGDLYFSNNGGNRTKVPGAEEVMSVWTTPINAFYSTRDYEYFRSNGNERFSVFHTP